jgi:hypothetical protein
LVYRFGLLFPFRINYKRSVSIENPLQINRFISSKSGYRIKLFSFGSTLQEVRSREGISWRSCGPFEWNGIVFVGDSNDVIFYQKLPKGRHKEEIEFKYWQLVIHESMFRAGSLACLLLLSVPAAPRFPVPSGIFRLNRRLPRSN